MTRRERLERKVEKRLEWAGKAEARSDAAYQTARGIVGQIPMGQPILVDHYSAKRHRSAIERADNNMRKSCEESKLSEHHTSKAEGLERQLETNIFSDDPDAAEQIQARIDEIEAECDLMKRANAAYRKNKGAGWASVLGITPEAAAAVEKQAADLFRICSYEKQPYPAYAISNRRNNQRRLKLRLVDVKARAQSTERAAAATNGVIVEGTGDYVRVTFAEKPDRAVLNDLRAAGFRWGGGAWTGKAAQLPERVKALTEAK